MSDQSRRQVSLERTIFLMLLVLLVVVRIVYLVQSRVDPGYRLFIYPDDQEYYYRVAAKIADGTLVGDSGNLVRGPGYAYFLGFLLFLSGKSLLFVRLMQSLLGIGTGMCLYVLARRNFGWVAALVALGLYALYMPVVVYESTLLMAPLITFLMTCGLMLFMQAVETRQVKLFALSGALFGWAYICRPNNLLAAVLLVGYMLVYIRSVGFKRLGVFCLGFAGVYGLLIVRNWLAGGDLMTVTTQGPIVLINSHVHDSIGLGWMRSAFEEKILFKAKGSTLELIRILVTDIARHFPRWLQLQFGKVYAYFFGFEFSQFIDFYLKRELMTILRFSVPYGFISALALTGALMSVVHKRSRYTALLLLYWLMLIVSVVIFYIIARFRQPAIPLFCIFAGYCSVTLFELRNWKLRAVYVFIGLLLIVVLNLPQKHEVHRKMFTAQSYYNRAMRYMKAGDFKNAAGDFHKYIDMRPQSPDGAYFLGRSYEEIGEYEKALKWFNYASVLGDEKKDLLFHIGVCYYHLEKYEKAVQFMERGIRTKQQQPSQYEALANAYMKLDNEEKALQIWNLMTSVFPDDYRGYMHLSKYYRGKNDYRRAREYMKKAMKRDPALGEVSEFYR